MQPPRPRLVLRMGVSGHRPNHFDDAAQEKVRQTLARIYAWTQESLAGIHRREAGVFDAAAPEVRIVSALAEGADRVVARAGLDAGFALDAIIPFAQDVYITDFTTQQSRGEFLSLLGNARVTMVLPGDRSSSDSADAGYEAAGLMTLRQSDMLIAIWDGKRASGRGGTGDIVQQAIDYGIPVLRFDADGNGPFHLCNDGDPANASDLAHQATAVLDEAALRMIVERLVAPPSSAVGAGGENAVNAARARLADYLGEHERRRNWAFSYPLLLRLLGNKSGFLKSFHQPPYLETTEEEWKDYWLPLAGESPALLAPIRDIVMVQYAWADKLANYYGQKHRSGYVRNFVLAAFAVFFALAAMAVENSKMQFNTRMEFATPFHGLEFFAIGAIIVFTWRANSARWHQRWLDYRQLAEQLRHLRARILTGSRAPEARAPHVGDELQPGPLWVNWYYRAAARQLGVPNVTAGGRFLEAARQAIGKGEVTDQCGYHRGNAHRMRQIANRLEKIGSFAFLVTFVICIGLLLSALFRSPHFPVGMLHWLDVRFPQLPQFEGESGLAHWFEQAGEYLSIWAPALGAALFGIRVEGDFEGASERSEDMARRLGVIAARLDDDKPMAFADLSTLTEEAASIMRSEVGDWGFVYRGKPLALPS
jgi:hypothetical protein